MVGLSTSGSISFGCALVAGRNLVPSPAAGKTAFRISAGIRYRISEGMLDSAYVRDNIELVRQRLAARGTDLTTELEQLASLEAQRRRMIPQVEGFKREQNTAGDEVARAKRQGLDARPVLEANKQRGQKIKQLEIELEAIEQQRTRLQATMPNLPHESVPAGRSAADNVVVRTWGEPRTFDFEPRAHWDIGASVGILDFERATKISGSRFSVLMG